MKPSTVRVDFKILHELLRLPPDVRIIGVTTPAPGACAIALVGAVPEGEVEAHYTYKHTTVVEFERFERLVAAPPKELP